MDITRELTGRGSAPDEAPAEVAAPASRDEGVAPPGAEQLHLLLFRLGRELFAIALAAVEEAIEMTAVERLPDMPEAMLGVCDVRGSLTPVYSPAGALRTAPSAARPEDGVMLLMRHGARRVGVTVDDVEDVIALEPGSLRQPALPGTTDGVILGIGRVGRELVAVIDPAALLSACGATTSGDRALAGAPAAAPVAEAA